ncbi:MAG: response regulator [Kofleriaceae bacterium]
MSILLVEDDEDTRELLGIALSRRGASVRLAASGELAMVELASAPPDIVLCDLGLPDGSGFEWLAKFRALPGIAAVPAIALSGHASELDREQSLAAGFEKHLNKPAALADIVTAIRALIHNSPEALQPLLSQLSDATGCRYTSLLRFHDNVLVSVWTYDRNQPRIDPFPIDLPIEASYCTLVQQAGEIIVIENAPLDPRADGHPKQHELATYIGAPVFGADGKMFGTLCSYDVGPRTLDATARTAIAAAARTIESTLQIAE